MPTIEERLIQINLKIKRAKHHIEDLQAEILRFKDGEPYQVATKQQADTGKLVYYVSRVNPVPDCFALIAADAIQNLMSALDHLAYQIVCSDTTDSPPNPNWIYFPIADDAAKYETKKHGKMEGARQESFDAIDFLKPYKGGNDLLWTLYRLNNIEKHRLLLTVGSNHASINFGQIAARYSPSAPEWAIDMFQKASWFIQVGDGGFPLKEGHELYVGAVGEKPDLKQQFSFGIALDEPGIIKSQSLLETLHQLSTLVEGIIASLTPRLISTP